MDCSGQTPGRTGSGSRTDLGAFPRRRMRRNRRTPWLRDLVRENALTARDLIWPVFVTDGSDRTEPVPSMPEVVRYSADRMPGVARKAADLGIPVLAVFPNTPTDKRTDDGREAVNAGNLVCQAVRQIKEAVPEIGVMCDVALDPYTAHGHDGLIEDETIVNDPSVEVLCRQALVQAEAGCDIIAPSDMMDGRIGAIRDSLDSAGFADVAIMAYAAKYASAFYGPFRDAVGASATLQGDKKTYQMDPANGNEAMREIALDIAEGADMVMVKPGLPYLDIVARAKNDFGMPTFAYQVSGEYSMVMAAAANGWIDADKAMLESLIAFKRAGADGVLTYFAPKVAEMVNSSD